MFIERILSHCSIGVILRLIICLALSPQAFSAEENLASANNPAIVFLHLRIDSSGVELIEHRVVTGQLKIPKRLARDEGLYFEAQTSAGQYYSEVMEDPLLRVFEYEDSDNPGQLKIKIVNLTEAEFWIRIPYRSDASQIVFRPDYRANSVPSVRVVNIPGYTVSLDFLPGDSE